MMNKAKKNKIQKLKHNARSVDRAHKHQYEILKKKYRIETFLPFTVSFIVLFIFIGLLGDFLIKKFTADTPPEIIINTTLSEASIQTAETINQSPRYKILKNQEIIYGNDTLATLPKWKMFRFYPSQISAIHFTNTNNKISERAVSSVHLIALSLQQNQEIYNIMDVDIRTATLEVPQSARALFLANTTSNMNKLYDLSTLTVSAMDSMLTQLDAEYNAIKAQLNSAQDIYNEAYNNFQGNEAELSTTKIALYQGKLNEISATHKNLKQNRDRLANNKEVLKSHEQLIQANLEPLIAGVQVDIVNGQNLGLIKN